MGKISHSEIVKQEMPEIRKDILDKEIEYPENIPLPEKIIQDIYDSYYSYSIWEIIWWLIKRPAKIIKLIYGIVKLIDKVKIMTKDKSKTTFMATAKVILALLATVIGLFGLNIPPDTQTALLAIVGAVYVIVDWVQGFFTKDKPEKK